MKLLTEDETIDAALAGRSIARLGDGELRLAVGGKAAAQRRDDKLRDELQRMLLGPTKSLVCLPRLVAGDQGIAMPAKQHHIWTRYMGERRYKQFYRQAVYGSTHVTRPDSAPWIDRPDYWAKVRALWAGKNVVLVKGKDRNIRLDLLTDARSVVTLEGPAKNAYAEVNTIEKDILWEYNGGSLERPDIVILCLGPTATVLAERLTKQGVHALDLGHLFMMLRRIAEDRRTWFKG